MSTFTVAGVATKGTKTSYKFANGTAQARTKALEKAGFTDVKLVDLPSAMDKESAIAFLGAELPLAPSKKSNTVKISVAKKQQKELPKFKHEGKTELNPEVIVAITAAAFKKAGISVD